MTLIPNFPHASAPVQVHNSLSPRGFQVSFAQGCADAVLSKTKALADSILLPSSSQQKRRDGFLAKDILHGRGKPLFTKEPRARRSAFLAAEEFVVLPACDSPRGIQMRAMAPQTSSLPSSPKGAEAFPSFCLHIPIRIQLSTHSRRFGQINPFWQFPN